LTQVTAEPVATVSVAGSKAKFLMSISAAPIATCCAAALPAVASSAAQQAAIRLRRDKKLIMCLPLPMRG